MDISRPVLSVRRLPIRNTFIQVFVKVSAITSVQDIAITYIICILEFIIADSIRRSDIIAETYFISL